MRIAKAMARAGLCSRRDAERWIAEGRVSVNGVVLASPAVTVGPADTVEVDGQPLRKAEPARLWRYHKPRGRVTTHRDPEGRPTVFEAMPEDMPRVVSIGRLDFNTEGLLLLTTNGALARHLELPATGWLRRYRVRAHGSVSAEALAGLADGVSVDGVHYGPVEATLDHAPGERTSAGANIWMTIGLREGKNREVRKILNTLGLEVTRLIRISFGPFELGELPVGAVAEIEPRVLAEHVGVKMAAELALRHASTAGDRPRRPAPARDKPLRQNEPGPRRNNPRVDEESPEMGRRDGRTQGAHTAQGLAHGRRAHPHGASQGAVTQAAPEAEGGVPPGRRAAHAKASLTKASSAEGRSAGKGAFPSGRGGPKSSATKGPGTKGPGSTRPTSTRPASTRPGSTKPGPKGSAPGGGPRRSGR